MALYFIWDIDPELLSLWAGFSIRYYSLLFLLGFLLGYWWVAMHLKKSGIPQIQIDQLTIYIMIGMVVGARLGHCLFYEPMYYLQHPAEMLLPFQITASGFEWVGYRGLASHGGGIGVLLAILLFSKKVGLPFLAVLDQIVLGIPITCTFIRLGNFMNSEIIGIPTRTDYGVVFKQIDNLPRHPAQLYEAAAYFLVFISLNWWSKRKKNSNGHIFGLLLILICLFRFGIEFIKENQVAMEEGMQLNMGQLLSIPFIFIGIFLLIKNGK